MNRVTRTMVASLATATLLAAAPAAVAAPDRAHGDRQVVKDQKSVKDTAKDKAHGKAKDTAKDKAHGKAKDKGNKAAKNFHGQRRAALAILRSLDVQLAKAAAKVEDSYEVIADLGDVQAALLDNVAADRAALADTKADLLAADTVAEVKEAKADLSSYHVANYDKALDLLEWASDNVAYVDGEPGYEAALAKIDEAVAILITVDAATTKSVLVQAKRLLEESDLLIEEADESLYGDEDADFDDEDFEDEDF